jgi:hypothetical protein
MIKLVKLNKIIYITEIVNKNNLTEYIKEFYNLLDEYILLSKLNDDGYIVKCKIHKSQIDKVKINSLENKQKIRRKSLIQINKYILI